jgi:hypothetical protein
MHRAGALAHKDFQVRMRSMALQAQPALRPHSTAQRAQPGNKDQPDLTDTLAQQVKMGVLDLMV